MWVSHRIASFLLFACLCECSIITRVVRTKYGDLTGTIVTPNTRYLDSAEVYRGVPYAAPPVGTLRFMPPVSGAQWSGVKMADKFAPVCPQQLPDIEDENILKRMQAGRLAYLKRLLPYLRNQSEDCLYLNIYAPTQDGEQLKKYPVLVFVHGESFAWNSGNPYDGTVLSSFAKLVVITVNYRLGLLGFLNTNTDSSQKSPSNYGLMDLIAALHWIQENVGFFGGDSTNVTVAGHGTGAACVNFLMASTAVPEGLLFHRAILMSGSALSPWALVKEPSLSAKQVAQYANCSFQMSHQILLKCLREKPLEVLLQAPVQVPEFNIKFGPNIDGVVIDIALTESRKQISGDTPAESDIGAELSSLFAYFPLDDYATQILNNTATKEKLIAKYSRYDLMTGIVPAESFFIFSNDEVQYGIEPDRRADMLKTFVKNTYRYHLSEILATVVNEYTEWERPIQHPINVRDETLEAISDAQYGAPITQTADLHSSSRRNSFFYVFEYQSKYGDYPQRQGCVHGEELPYFFGSPLVGGLEHFPKNYTKSEVSLSEAFMLYISNFARTGNPNDPGPNQHVVPKTIQADKIKLKNIEWTPYESIHKKYLSLDTKLKLKDHYRAHKLSYWLNLIPELHRPGSDDVPPSHHQFQPEEVVFPHHTFTVSNSTSIISKIQPSNDSTNLDLPVVVVASSSSNRNPVTPVDVQPKTTGWKEIFNLSNYSLALIITVTIGGILLLFNVLVFLIVYHRKEKPVTIRKDKCTESIKSLGSSNSLNHLALQNVKKISENGGPSLNANDAQARVYFPNQSDTSPSGIADQSVTFLLEPLKPNHCQYHSKRPDPPNECGVCSTLPSRYNTHTFVPKSSDYDRVFYSDQEQSVEIRCGTVPRKPKSILKNQSINTDDMFKYSDDYNRIRV